MDLLSSGKSVPIAEPADPLVAGAASTAAATQLPAGLVGGADPRRGDELVLDVDRRRAEVVAGVPSDRSLTSVVFFCSAGISERTLRRRCADSSENPDDAVADVLAGKKNLPRTPGHRSDHGLTDLR